MAIGQYRLQFLHISDLHARGPNEKESWRRRRVLGDPWLRNLETLLAEEGLIHFVFFTATRRNRASRKSLPKSRTFSRPLRAARHDSSGYSSSPATTTSTGTRSRGHGS